MIKKISVVVLMMFAVLFLSYPVFGKEDPKKEEANNKKVEKKEDQKTVRLWIGYSWYNMKDFNDKLSRENNNTIDGGVNIGLELSPGEVEIPPTIPLIGGRSKILPMIGFEYLGASSKTTHTGVGGSATVNWDLPVIGIYLAPDIEFSEKPLRFYLRPIGVGYYTLGKLTDAKLTVSDRSGSLEVSDETVGITSQIGMKYIKKDKKEVEEFEIFIEGGYRWLKFTDVSQEPKGGFRVTPGGPLVQPGNLPESLDYSGFIIKVGIGVKF